MTNQKINETIKALAYGETPEEIAEAEGVTAAEADQVRRDYAVDIEYEKNTLRKAGYLDE